MGAIYTNSRPCQPSFRRFYTGYNWSFSYPGKDTRTDFDINTFAGAQGIKDGTFGGIKDTVTSYRTKSDEYFATNDSAAARRLLEDNLRKQSHDYGHEFDLRKFSIRWPSRIIDIQGPAVGGGYYHYKGPMGIFSFYPITNRLTDFQGIGTWSYDTKIGTNADPAMGTKAISAASPVKRNANLAVAITEIFRDGLPSLPGASLKKQNKSSIESFAKGTSEEYLNYIFGWVPTISDIRQVLTAMVKAPKILNQFSKDSDKIVRRRYAFPPSVSTRMGSENYSGSTPLYFIPQQGGGGNSIGSINGGNLTTGTFQTKSGGSLVLDAVETAHTQVWFSGAFRYHMTIGDDVFSRMNRVSQRAAVLLGLRLDLETFYTAFPWSWLVDWFSDLGAIVRNGNAQWLDGQVLQYGYLMQHDVLERTFTAREPVYFRQGSRETALGNPTVTYVSQRKQRIRATPFGFGLNPNTFSAQQWAILGALGLTRTPGKLW